ncbi:MAG TPA: MerR family transcriptional regulator [Thermoanaerobaculia bacterium]|nr:MerR family transcriptional regulator [Thermoanaerobaculia bacterium]
MTAEDPENRTYKIGEVCRIADLQPYVLRYWETEFPPLAPSKGGGGQRAYTRPEIEIILRIKQLLYSEGFTIAGAKKKLEAELDSEGHLAASGVTEENASDSSIGSVSRGVIREAIEELRGILKLLE